MKTVVGLLRHGQTDWNIDMRLQGISDIPLNETGRSQARRVAEVLAKQDWQTIVSSPLSRARDTAAAVAEAMGLAEINIEQLLLERSFGVAEGLSYEDWRERLQAGVVAAGAESIEELEDRVHSLLSTLESAYRGQKVLTVSHGALIRKVISIVSNGKYPAEGDRFSNASLSVIEFDDGAWSIVEYNPHSLAN